MKRKVATRKLRRCCRTCGKGFKKGEVYYIHRKVFEYFYEIFAIENLICPKCKYREEKQKERYEQFKGKCEHPEKFIEEIWDYIPGEAVMQPDHDVCRLCGEWV